MSSASRARSEGAPVFEYRLSIVDWQVIDAALALYATEFREEYIHHTDSRIEATRLKVMERLDRAARNK